MSVLCQCSDPFYGLPLQNGTCNAASSILFMSIMNSLLRIRCDISDICGRVKPTKIPENEYDFVVIGGGGGGSVIAGRLSENPNWKVLVLEMGDDEPVGGQVPSFAYSFIGPKATTITYQTEPQENACLEHEGRRCSWSRGKLLGGCSSINGMTYMRGVPQDYDNWAKLGNTGWSYEDVLPVFKKSENNGNLGVLTSSYYHGVGGPLSIEINPDKPKITDDILQAARDIGYQTPTDLNADVLQGFTISQTFTINGTRDSTAKAYLRPARFRQNLNIMLNSTVTKIHFSKNEVKATSVDFYYRGNKFNVKIKKEVILAGGAIGSPQLLLLSGIGPEKELEEVKVPVIKDLPGVGKNFLNHVAFFIQFNLKKEKNNAELNWDNVLKYLKERKGPLSYFGLALLSSRFSSSINPNQNWPDMQFYFNGFLANCTYGCGSKNDPADPQHPNATRRILFQSTLVRPKSIGYLKLRSNNPFEQPILQPNLLNHDYDVKALISGVRTAIKLGTQGNLREKYGSELVRGEYGNCSRLHQFDSDDFWECAIRYSTYPENHLAGTLKMGPSTDKLAVVSPELKVYGTSNVRVADASAMPVTTAGNILSTVVLIAEKAAEFVRKDWS